MMVYGKIYRDSSDISVIELFSDPEINVNPYLVTEGADVTLTCDTRLAASREQTDLWFAFYKNGRKVQEFGKSNLHTINSVQLRDSGNYTCEVTTQSSSVRKTSKGMDIKMTGSALKPAVFLLSKWRKILTEESVTLACNVESSYQGNGTYSWYKDDKKIDGEHRVYTIQSARLEDSGDYTCELRDSDRSDPLTLRVRDDLVILQSSPSPVYEGETLTLRCHHRGGYTMQSSTFYKGSQVMESYYGDSFYLMNVDKTAAGTYTCTKVMRVSNIPFADSVDITVKELFTDPDILLSPYLLTVGDTMTMTCHTRLAPLRAHTELQFTFYRNGEKVQDFGKSSRYKITSIQTRDSGNYTCEVRTVIGHVKKTSPGINIEIGEKTSGFPAYLIPTIVPVLLLVLFILIFTFRHKISLRPARKTRRPEPTVPTRDNSEGDDVCYSYINMRAMPPPGSSALSTTSSVIYSAVRFQNTTGDA
uniref:Ig-like domain-containing protein n=1 Tax=Leptobrachium leishanense TaxID=445787 RepID=A0A8C5MVA9_9ANUR